jgi:hypothetical protein
MRSESETSLPDGALMVRLSPASAAELAHKARAYRARVVGEMLADAIVWLVRLPRRIADLGDITAPKQRV